MSIEIIPTGAALGAEIRGVDLARPIDDETFAAIERAYNDHAVIFFRAQHITPPQQVAFTRRYVKKVMDRCAAAPNVTVPQAFRQALGRRG
jgi:alpha-ketoglutarate-dependent taurine dioxygenase